MILFHRAAAVALAVVTLAAALIGAPAQAVPVTVGGTTYDVQFFPGGQSFDDNRASLKATPWFGDATLASDLADAYRDQVATPYPFDDNIFIDYLFFAHEETGGTVSVEYLVENGFRSSFDLSDAVKSLSFQYAYSAGTVSAVPEIDGNALAQAGLILLALFLVLRGRRPDMA
jgi:hypothetical protein